MQAPARRPGPVSKLILCRVSSVKISRPLIGRKYECYIVIEVIDVDELDKGNISAAAEKKTNNGRLSLAYLYCY